MSSPASDPPKHVLSCLVLGYDRTESGRLAATWAARQLQPEGMLVIVHSSRSLHVPASPLASTGERHEIGRALIDELLLEGSDSLFDIDIDVVLSDEDPVSALIDAAREHHAQAIVIGHEQHASIHRAIGTVTNELLDRSPVPVIAVPLTSAPVTSGLGAVS